MVDTSDEPPQKAKRRRLTPEEVWIRSFLGFSGTDNVCRCCLSDLGGISLTRAVEALTCGECTSAEKCDGSGTVCIFEHKSDDDEVEVSVFFVAPEEVIEIQWARVKKEAKGEPNAA